MPFNLLEPGITWENSCYSLLTREAPAKCSSLLVVLVMGQAKQAARSRAGAMSRGIKFYDVRPEAQKLENGLLPYQGSAENRG